MCPVITATRLPTSGSIVTPAIPATRLTTAVLEVGRPAASGAPGGGGGGGGGGDRAGCTVPQVGHRVAPRSSGVPQLTQFTSVLLLHRDARKPGPPSRGQPGFPIASVRRTFFASELLREVRHHRDAQPH